MTTKKFTVEITVDDSEELPSDSTTAADELLDAFADYDGYPAWVQSIDSVDPTRLEVWG